MGAVAWICVGVGLVLFGLTTEVMPNDWILSIVGGGIIGSNIARMQAGL